MALTPKQAAFCREYLIDLNATQAAIRAGYSAKNADQVAARLVGKSQVAAEIARLQTEREKRTEVRADQVLKELANLAFGDWRGLFRADGSLKPVGEMTRDEAAMLSSVEVFEEFSGFGEERELVGHVRKIRRWDKLRALELVGKHLGMFTEKHKHEVTGRDGGPVQTESAGPDLKKMSRDELRTYLAALRAAASGGSGGGDPAAGR